MKRLNELEDQNPDQQQKVHPQQAQTEPDQGGRLQVRRGVFLVDIPDCLDGVLEERYGHRDSSGLISRYSGKAR
jgi:hypothetical protein